MPRAGEFRQARMRADRVLASAANMYWSPHTCAVNVRHAGNGTLRIAFAQRGDEYRFACLGRGCWRLRIALTRWNVGAFRAM